MRTFTILLCALLAGGCATRRSASSYRLVPVAGQSLLLPPGIELPKSPGTRVQFPFRTPGCKLEGPQFSAGGSAVSFPPASTLLNDSTLPAEFDSFLTRMEACTGSRTRTMLLTESIPSPPAQTLAYLYSYRPGEGIVDLAPGSRITILRARFTAEAEAKSDYTIANYTGTNTTTYDVLRDHGQISFRLAQTNAGNAQSDTQIATRCARLPYYRLFLLTQFVPKKLQRTAMLIGAESRVQLAELTRAIRSDPEAGCAVAKHAACVEFAGKVTVSVELGVLVNGTTKYVALGSMLRTLLAPRDLSTLRLRRQFAGKLTPVVLPAPNASALDLVLAAGDEISW